MAHGPSWTSRSRTKDSRIWRVVADLEAAGPIADQAALHALLAKVRDLALPGRLTVSASNTHEMPPTLGSLVEPGLVLQPHLR